MAESTEKTERSSETAAVIDIGSNAVRMVVAQVYPDGRIDRLETAQPGDSLGRTPSRCPGLRRPWRRAITILGIIAAFWILTA